MLKVIVVGAIFIAVLSSLLYIMLTFSSAIITHQVEIGAVQHEPQKTFLVGLASILVLLVSIVVLAVLAILIYVIVAVVSHEPTPISTYPLRRRWTL